MHYLSSLWLLVLSSFFCTTAISQSPDPISSVASEESGDIIVLATNISSSFSADATSNEDAQALLPRLDCVFEKMDRRYRVQITPWRRAYLDVKSQRVDGFFTAIPMRDADQYATLSAPLVLENWYWFWRNDTEAPHSWREGYKLGSILGSQQESWLAEAGYSVDMSANNLPQLIKLLQSKRIDVLLADHEHFIKALEASNMSTGDFQSRFFRYMPLGVYFNQKLLDRDNNFLSVFNKNIIDCAASRFQVSAGERQKIATSLATKVEVWKKLPGLEAALKKANRENLRLNATLIKAKDEEWTRAFVEQDVAFANGIINKKLSEQLRIIKQQEGDVITEIIVTDARGLNVAISDMTSDYWQGDEDKFIQVFGKSRATLYVGDINYDESTRHFQVQVSFPLHAHTSRESLGVMVVGVDVEKILSQDQ